MRRDEGRPRRNRPPPFTPAATVIARRADTTTGVVVDLQDARDRRQAQLHVWLQRQLQRLDAGEGAPPCEGGPHCTCGRWS